MGAALDLSIDLHQIADWCERQAKALEALDLTPVWRPVALYLASQAKRTFVRQTAPDGSPWAPFKRPPSKKRGGKSAKLLRDTGLLMASYQGGTGHVDQRGKHLLTWGSNLDRAGWHHYGTGTIPARPQLGITPEMEEIISEMVADQVGKLLGGK